MYQNYNYQQPTQMRPQMQMPAAIAQPGLKGRPVSSLEEARAASIDFDGSIFYFPDYANKKIYTKQINMDGTSSFMLYELKELPVEKKADFVTREEFGTVIQQLTQSLRVVPTVEAEPPQEKPQFKF